MMRSLALLFLVFAFTQALEPLEDAAKSMELFPKKTLAEWQKILENIKYTPKKIEPRGIFPQPASAGKTLTPRIVGGDNAQTGQFPWQTFIIMDNSYVCGGSLLSESWILTAGHCVSEFSQFVVRAGSVNANSGGQVIQTSSSILHSGYDDNTLVNDIGLLRVSGFSLNSNTNPVKLPSSSVGDLVGTTARVSGFGKTSDNGGVSSVLKFVDLPIIDPVECVNVYGSLESSQICASAANHRSICGGDSGGPLVIQGDDGLWVEVGVVSFGHIYGCELGYPVGFTRVTSFLDWISSNSGLRVY